MKVKLLILSLFFSHFLAISSEYSNAKPVQIILDDIEIFPNPATTIVTIKMPNGESSLDGTAELYNVLGKKLKTVSLSSVNTSVYIDDLPKGVYLLSIKMNDMVAKTLKLIKQ